MARVYDPEKEKTPKQSSASEEFDKIVDKNFSPGDERMMEERAERGAREDQKKDNTKKESEGDESNSGLYNPGGSTAGKTSGGMLQGKGQGGLFSRLRKKRKQKKGIIIASGIVGGLLLAGLILVFGLLNLFKLDHLMSNLDNRVYSRLQAASDSRSSKLTAAYIRMRLAEVEDPSLRDGSPEQQDNLLYRSDRVDQNKPFTDWYKTMRASRFEERLLEKHGIKFTSVAVKTDSGIRHRVGKVTISDKPIDVPITAADVRAIEGGDVTAFNGKLRNFVEVQVFENNKDARKAIRKAIRDETRFWQVMKRRTVRKSIYNMTGVREWRFFETTRDKVEEKRVDIRNRLVLKAIPESTKSGKYLRCLFGVADCKAGDDPANPENKDNTSTIGVDRTDNSITDVDRDPNTPNQNINYDGNELLKSILKKANLVGGAVNWLSLIDVLAKVDENIKNQKISKTITIAKGVQAMALYQVLGTARDQIKSGEVNAAEVNPLMQVVGTAGNSEAWASIVSNNGENVSSTKMTREQYCSPENQAKVQDVERHPDTDKQFHYVCDDQRIGSGTNAARLEKAYNASIGKVIGPIAEGYRDATDTPIIGDIINAVLDVFEFIGDQFTQLILGIAGILGLADDIKEFMGWIFGKLAAFLGAGPIIQGKEAGGIMMNWGMQGGAFTAETTARDRGAAALQPAQRVEALRIAAAFERSEAEERGWVDKFASLSNHQSVASTMLFSVANSVSPYGSGLVEGALGMRGAVANILFTPFGSSAQAERVNPDAAADFSEIQKYDWPKQCFEMDPLLTKPSENTNIMEVLSNVTEDELTWDVMTKSASFYQLVYTKIGDRDNPDEIAKKIWNCHLLDTSVRGGLGYVYNYKDDDGLEEGQSVGSGTTETAVGSVAGATIDMASIGLNSDTIACAPNTKDIGVVTTRYRGSYKQETGALKIRLCQLSSIGGEGNNTSGVEIGGGAILNSRVSGAWQALGEAAKAQGVELTSNSSFRLADSCGGTGDGSLCASPGGSPHQLGVAIDLNIGGTGSGSSTSCSGRETANTPGWIWMNNNAPRFGLYQYSKEAWHWDPLLPSGNRCGG